MTTLTTVDSGFESLFEVLEDEFVSFSGSSLTRVTFDLSDRRLELYLAQGFVVSLIDSSSQKDIDLLATVLSFSEPLESKNSSDDKADSSKPAQVFVKLHEHSLNNAVVLDRSLRYGGLGVKTFIETDFPNFVSNYFSLEPAFSSSSKFIEEVQNLMKQEAALAEELGVDDIPWTEQELLLLDETFSSIDETAEKLIEVAKVSGSLQDYVDFCSSSSIVELLSSVASLVDAGVIAVNRPQNLIEGDSTWLLDENDTPVSVPVQWNPEPDEEPEEFVAATGEFYVATPLLTESIESDIRYVMDAYMGTDSNKFKLFEMLLENSRLIADVRATEGELGPLTRNYLRSKQEVDEARMEQSFNAFDDDDESESNPESLAQDSRVREKLSQANQDFFVIERLERRRSSSNEARRDVLEKIMMVLPDREDTRLDEVRDLIERKIEGIDAVKNIAYHPENATKTDGRLPKVSSAGLQFGTMKVNARDTTAEINSEEVENE